MFDDDSYHLNKKPGKTYVSRRIVLSRGNLRHASKVLDLDEGYLYAKEKDELVIRQTTGGRKEIIAKFFEDPRGISVVTIQSFNPEKGSPQKTYFSFVGKEIKELLNFFRTVSEIEFQDEKGINASDEDVKKLILSPEQAKSLVHDNQDLFSQAIRSEITKGDVIALGYRKKQLEVFSRLLSDRDYFNGLKLQKKCRGDESLWQMYFEKNQWVFGYGLNYVFVTGFEERKLEQIVRGADVLHKGKRVDALMKTIGAVSSLCFVEIKTHETPLLDSASYRSGCWAVSRELAGAVAQVQGTVATAVRNLSETLRPVNVTGDPTGEEIFSFQPRAFLVIGSLSEFVTEHGVNSEKLRSFELYRRNLVGVDIFTFDELYERTQFIVEGNASQNSAHS